MIIALSIIVIILIIDILLDTFRVDVSKFIKVLVREIIMLQISFRLKLYSIVLGRRINYIKYRLHKLCK
jgi:hypothetical protein